MATLTIKHYIDLVTSFISNVKSTRNAYYMFAGRPKAWLDSNGQNPDSPDAILYNTATDTVLQNEQSIYDDLLFGKLIGNTDIQYMIPRYNWTNNTPYARYDQNDTNLYNEKFCVVNDTYQVYKVINNNNGANSTIKPTLNSTTGTFSTGDGYVWKYMYTIDSASNTKFTSNSYIPVVPNTYVSNNAIPGSIDSAVVTNGGTNYQVFETGYLQNLIGPYSVQLPETSSPFDNYYTNSSIYLKSGFGSGQIRQIQSYDGGSKKLVSTLPFDFHTNIELGSINGTVAKGYQAIQPITYVYINNTQGFFNAGDTVTQTNTFATGLVLTSNGSTLEITTTSVAQFSSSFAWPLVNNNDTGTLQTGTVSISAGGFVASVVGASFNPTSIYTAGQYIRIGNNPNVNVRRIVSLNSTSITVDVAFDTTSLNAAHYLVHSATEPYSLTQSSASGYVSDLNLTSQKITLGNLLLPGVSFTTGELVTLVDSANTFQGANGTVAYSNTSTVTLSNVLGTWLTSTTGAAFNGFITGSSLSITSISSGTIRAGQIISGTGVASNTVITSGSGLFWQVNNIQSVSPTVMTTINPLYALGQSSQQIASISKVATNPNITVQTPSGTFVSGMPIYFRNTATNANTGNAIIQTYSTVPNSLTEYVISPTVVITGDGSGALAYATVNNSFGSANNITGVVFLNAGTNYTQANITFQANSSYGSGATANPIISPINGHGFDAVTELGARYCGITSTFDTLQNESYYNSYSGPYRKVGILEDPMFADIQVKLNSFDRVKMNITSPSGSFITGEIVINTANGTSSLYSNASGICVYSNSSYLELKNVKGTWTNTVSTLNKAYGVSSNTHANVATANVSYFSVGSAAEILSETTSGATADILSIITNTSNTQIELGNITGQFSINDQIYDPVVNAYANVTNIYASNGQIDVSSIFAKKFNDMARITLTSATNTIPFQQYETVQQEVTYANGVIVSTTNDMDLKLTLPITGSFNVGDTITEQTYSNTATVIYANNTSGYLKLTAVSNTLNFSTGVVINNGLGGSATISAPYSVLVLNNVNGPNKFQASSSNNIVGQTSGAKGICSNSSLITYPDLVRNSGRVIYFENFAPVTKNANSAEQITLVIKF